LFLVLASFVQFFASRTSILTFLDFNDSNVTSKIKSEFGGITSPAPRKIQKYIVLKIFFVSKIHT